MNRGLVIGQSFARGITHKLKLEKRMFGGGIVKTQGSINNNEDFNDASYNPQERLSLVQPQALSDSAPEQVP